MTYKFSLALLVSTSLALFAAGAAGPVQAQGLQLKDSARTQPRTAQPRHGQQRLTGPQRRTRGEVLASQDFASECNEYGGGASTDPTGVESCTTPDGDPVIVPFP